MHISEKYVASNEIIMSRTHQQSDSSRGSIVGADEAGPSSKSLRAGGGARQLSSAEVLSSPKFYNLSSEAATELPSRVTCTPKKTRRRGDEISSLNPKSFVEMPLSKMQKTMEAAPLKFDLDPPLRKARVSVRARSDAATVSDRLFP